MTIEVCVEYKNRINPFLECIEDVSEISVDKMTEEIWIKPFPKGKGAGSGKCIFINSIKRIHLKIRS